MNNFFESAIILFAGFATGSFFFGGLWFTVQKGMAGKIPALWFVISFIIRMTVTLFAFYFLTEGTWQRLLLCFAGFLIARVVVTKFTKNKQLKSVKEELA